MTDADLDLQACQRPAQVVDDLAPEGCGGAEHQVAPDRLIEIEPWGVSPAIVVLVGTRLGQIAGDPAPGEAEPERGPADLEPAFLFGLRQAHFRPCPGLPCLPHRSAHRRVARWQPHIAEGVAAVRPGGQGGQDGAIPGLSPSVGVEEVDRGCRRPAVRMSRPRAG